jgi:hypothetical protein
MASAILLLSTAGCATPAQTAGLAVASATLVGAHSPAHEVEQIYYLGAFDPTEQLPPTIYRVTVRGQASFLSGTKFGSGWVPAGIIDSLNGRVKVDPNAPDTGPTISGDAQARPTSKLDRRLVMFGPEGFREAPKDHRLVIVMGASPKGWFDAVDMALADMSSVTIERGNSAVQGQLLEEIDRLAAKREAIAKIEKQVREGAQ